MTTSLKALCLGLLSLPFLPTNPLTAAESSTPVIGYYKQTFPGQGLYTVAVGLVNKSDFQGASATAPTVVGESMTITQTGASWATNQFATATPSHYVEVVNCPGHPEYAGMVLDVQSNSATQIVCAVPAGFAPTANFSYLIRKHVTLGSLLGDSSGVVAYEDLVVVYDSQGSEITASYEGAGVWKDALSPAIDVSNFVFYPGHGFVFLPNDVRTLTIGGGAVSYVKSGPTRVSLTANAPAIIGLVNPLVATDPGDVIYSTSGVNTLTEMGFRDPANLANGILADTDSITLLSSDGSYTALNTVGKSSATNDLVELISISAGNLNETEVRNGQAVFYYPGDNSSLLLPQRH